MRDFILIRLEHGPCTGNTSIFSDRVDSQERALSCLAYSVGPTREFEECGNIDREIHGENFIFIFSLESIILLNEGSHLWKRFLTQRLEVTFGNTATNCSLWLKRKPGFLSLANQLDCSCMSV